MIVSKNLKLWPVPFVIGNLGTYFFITQILPEGLEWWHLIAGAVIIIVLFAAWKGFIKYFEVKEK